MTNGTATGLAVAILLGLGLDIALADGAAGLFLARRFTLLIEWLAFWR
jgi:hypothetical protein